MDDSPSSNPQRYKPTLLYRLMEYFTVPLIMRTWVRMEVQGLEHIPRAGPLIVVSNHVDNNDTYVIGRYLPGVVHYLARPGGMESRVLGRFWHAMAAIPADREGLRQALAYLKMGDMVGVYPDGVITPALLRAKAGVAALAVRAGVPVLPVAVWGTERVRIFPLPKGRRRTVYVRFGTPRRVDRREVRGKGLQQIADELMADVAVMLPPEYRGYYAGAAAGVASAASRGSTAPSRNGTAAQVNTSDASVPEEEEAI
jgi:1-acyl-sn-glycerol-3-phosphate acyltransferase